MLHELAIVSSLPVSLSITANACCTSFSIRANLFWDALAVPMVFYLVRNASGEFIAAARAIAALVFGVALGVVMLGCCQLTFRVVCRTLETVASLFRSLSPCTDSPRVVSPRGDSFREVCCSGPGTLKTVASLFWLGTLGSAP